MDVMLAKFVEGLNELTRQTGVVADFENDMIRKCDVEKHGEYIYGFDSSGNNTTISSICWTNAKPVRETRKGFEERGENG